MTFLWLNMTGTKSQSNLGSALVWLAILICWGKEMNHLKVVPFIGPITGNIIPPENVLNGAIDAGLTEVTVIGYDQDGQIYVASTTSPADVMWCLEEAKHYLLTRDK